MTLDLDSKLIAALQRNGRATYRELSVAVDAPRAAVSTRVQALLDSGTVSVVAVAHTRTSRIEGACTRLDRSVRTDDPGCWTR